MEFFSSPSKLSFHCLLAFFLCFKFSYELYCFCVYVVVKVKGLTPQSCPTLWDAMDCNRAPLSMGFSRQEWSWLQFLSLGDIPDPEIEPGLPAFQMVSVTF